MDRSFPRSLLYGNLAERPSIGTVTGQMFIATDQSPNQISIWDGSRWQLIGIATGVGGVLHTLDDELHTDVDSIDEERGIMLAHDGDDWDAVESGSPWNILIVDGNNDPYLGNINSMPILSDIDRDDYILTYRRDSGKHFATHVDNFLFSGNKIMRFDAGGSHVSEYAMTNNGLSQALSDSADGDTVWVPPGELVITSGHTIPDGVTLTGAGMRATVLKLEDSHDANITMFTVGSNCTLSSMEINGNFENQSSGSQAIIFAEEESYINIECLITYPARSYNISPIEFDNCSHITIQHCEIHPAQISNGYSNIDIHNKTVEGIDFKISNNLFINDINMWSHNNIIYLEGADDFDWPRHIRNAEITNNIYRDETGGRDGIFVDAYRVDGINISNNTVNGFYTLAYCQECVHVVIADNVAHSCGEDYIGILASSSLDYDAGNFAQWFSITGNVLTGGNYGGIWITGPGSETRNSAEDEAGAQQARGVVANNVIDGVWYYTIDIGEVAHVNVVGNVVNNCGDSIAVNHSWECNIVGNLLTNCYGWYGGIGIGRYGRSYNIRVSSNYIARPDEEGIVLGRATECVVSDNYIISASQDEDVTYSSISLEEYTVDCRVVNNTIKKGSLTNQPAYGINIDSGSSGTFIMDNDVADGGVTGTILDNGTGTIWGNMQSARTNLTSDFTHNSTGNWVSVEWDGTDHDWGDLWVSGSPTRLTFAVGGLIDFDAELAFAPSTTGERGIRFIIDGTTVVAQKRIDARGSSDDTWLDLSTKAKIDPDSYVEVEVYQDSGGNLNIQGGGDYTPHVAASAIGQP